MEAFLRASSKDKWLYTHGRKKWEVYYSSDALEWQKSFLDHFLKGEDNGFEKRPRIRLEVRRAKEDADVRGESAWPLERTRFTPYYLDPRRRRLIDAPPSSSQSLVYDSRAREAVEFDLPFDRPTEVTGPVVLKLWVSAEDADDLDLFVAIDKIDHSGKKVDFIGTSGLSEGHAALGWLRVSQRHLDAERSKPWRPFLSHDRIEKLKPGEVVPVEIEILPSSTSFEAGETLRLSISGRDIFFEQDIFGHDDTVNNGRHELHVDADRPSHLILPIIPADDGEHA